jgi:sugar phosphate isomerase/epimerase
MFSLDPRAWGNVGEDALVAAAREQGLTGFEWSVLTHDQLAETPAEWGGLPLATVRVALSDIRDDEDVQLILATIGAAAQRGCRLVVGPAGNPAEERFRGAALDRLKRIGAAARAAGVVYAVESGPGLCRSHRTMLDLLHDLGGTGIRLSFDPVILHACNPFFNSEVALAKVCHAVAHVRIGDCTGDEGDTQRLPLGRGVVDFVRMGELLRVCGFLGPYCLGMPTDDTHDKSPGDAIAAAMKYLRQCGLK